MAGFRQTARAAMLAAAAITGWSAANTIAADRPERAPAVPKCGVFEIMLRCSKKLDNPFADAAATAEFTSPAGRRVDVGGFYYGRDQWRVRFVPRETGRWRYSARLVGAKGADRLAAQAGEFDCRPAPARGFLRLSKRNPYRMEYEDGTPFYPIGIQTCGVFRVGFDGPAEGAKWRTIPAAEWCKAFAGAVNLVRVQFGCGTTAGCALPLIPKDGPPDRYDTELAARIDDLYRLHRSHGLAEILILFQDMSLWGNGGTAFGNVRDLKGYKSLQAGNLHLQERYIRYVVARYGCFVDIWELFNEDSYAPDDYLAHLAKVIRQADPYDHIITTNYARPDQDWCEIVTWHEYMGMEPRGVDAYLTQVFARLKGHGKVVQNTEFGNQGQISNYDPVKWRVAVWTAFMNECGLLFWGMSGRKLPTSRPNARGNANAYIGPESRRHFRVLNEFTRGLPIDLRPAATGYTEHTDIRTCALSNGKTTVLYVHHFADHAKPFELPYPLFVKTSPGRFRVRWIDPADGKEIRTEVLATKQQFLEVRLPPVTIDAACRIDRVDGGG